MSKCIKSLVTKHYNFTQDYQIEYNDEVMNFKSCNPCIFKLENKYYITIRLVSYDLLNRIYHKQGVTINKLIELDDEFNSLNEQFYIPDKSKYYYVGYEDLKVFIERDTNEKVFLCSKLLSINNNNTFSIAIFKGTLNCIPAAIPIKSPFNNSIEKNWAYLGKNRVIYKWHPITIGRIKNAELIIEEQYNSPEWFVNLRGSTNAVYNELRNEVWFICHTVNDSSQQRVYTHCFVVLDTSYKLKRYSELFSFDEKPVEFALGMILEPDKNECLISYSTWDRTAYVDSYKLTDLESKLDWTYCSKKIFV